MAVEAPLLTRQRIFAAKVETTTGTAISLAAADAAFNAYNHSYTTTITRNRREGQSSLSQLPQVPGPRMAEITVETDLVGTGGGSQPAWTNLLLAAGFSGSATYVPATGSSSYTTLTAGLYQDGRFKSIAGAVADGVLRGSAGNPCRWFWRLRGVHQPPTSVALITPTYPTTLPPRLASATFTIGGTAYKLGSFELSLGNVIALREDASHVSGYHSAAVTDHDMTLRCSLESTAFGTHDFYADHLAGTEAALNLVIGGITITAPKMQLAEPPQDEDADGILRDNILFQLNRSASAGDDHLSIVVGS